jgi:hypothetical protein
MQLQVAARRLKYFIIAACNGIALFVQRYGQLMHYTSTYRYKMYFHACITKWQSKSFP